jgi:hypothetical protein
MEVIVNLIMPNLGGPPAICYHERSGYQPFPLVPRPDEVVVCTANDKVLIASGRAQVPNPDGVVFCTV